MSDYTNGDYTNGNYTKSSYTKTGKKVKCIYSGRIDLIYKKVYDVFIDVNSDEFVIDEFGNRYYDSMELPCWIEVTNETKFKFKVGDKVKVVDIGYISESTSDVKVGDVGVVTCVDSDYEMTPYRVEFDDDYWWFTDKCIELVNDDVNNITENTPKFKVGDKVKVIDIGYISDTTDDVKLGDVGVIVNINDNPTDPYRVKFNETDEKDCWWFTDKCIELVSDDVDTVSVENTHNKKYNPLVVQQSGNHYKNGKIQPVEYSERNNLSMCQGNIVKYITRHKEKNGVDDLAKVVHYALLEALFVYGEDGATELRDKVDSLINIGNN